MDNGRTRIRFLNPPMMVDSLSTAWPRRTRLFASILAARFTIYSEERFLLVSASLSSLERRPLSIHLRLEVISKSLTETLLNHLTFVSKMDVFPIEARLNCWGASDHMAIKYAAFLLRLSFEACLMFHHRFVIRRFPYSLRNGKFLDPWGSMFLRRALVRTEALSVLASRNST